MSLRAIRYRSDGYMTQLSRGTRRTLLYVFLAFIVAISIGPFLVLFVNATRSDAQIASSFSLIPGRNLIDNYRSMQERNDFPHAVRNSAIIAFAGTALAVYFGSLCGYALAKLEFFGRTVIFSIVLVTLMIPWQLGIIGYYSMIARMGLIDTYWPLILPSIGNPAVVFFLKQFIEGSIPTDLMEAARMEGAGELRIFHRIIIPMSAPAMATMGILTFVFLWNNYITPLMLLVSTDKFPVQVVLALLSTDQERRVGATYLGLSLSIILILIVYVTQSRRITENVAAGAVKG